MDVTFIIINSFFVFALGAVVGSFLNVCIYRMPLEISLIYPGSHCPICFHRIHPLDNIPLVSYILLKAKCRHCKTPISPRYFFVELLTAVMFVVFYFNLVVFRASSNMELILFNFSPLMVRFYVYAALASCLIVITFIDSKYFIIPDKISIPGIFIGPVLAFVWSGLFIKGRGVEYFFIPNHPHIDSLLYSLLGIVVGGGVIWVIGKFGKLLFRKEAMGFGDVKFMAFMGGFLGWKAFVIILVISLLPGIIYGVYNLIKKKEQMLPFGPFLSMAAIIYMLFPEVLTNVINLYVNVFAPLSSGSV